MVRKNNTKRTIISLFAIAIFIGIALFLGIWRFNIPLTVASSAGFWFYGWFVFIVPVAAIILLVILNKNIESLGWCAIPLVIWIILLIVFGFTGARMFNAQALSRQITVSEPVSFVDGAFEENEFPAFDPAMIPWIDHNYATILGDQRLGELGAIGASVEIGKYHRQLVGGQLFYVAPILHAGFFQRNEHPNGTPGFIMVNLSNPNDVRLVTDNPIRIQPSGHGAFGDKLERIVFNAHPTSLRFDPVFLVDDDLTPYWIVALRSNRIGVWNGADVDRVVLVNATTGQLTTYRLEDVPRWVDMIFPIDLIETQISNWGSLRGGWWNSTGLGRRSGLLQTEHGNAIVYSNGNSYLFEALTSIGSDESTVGFLMTNLRTRETTWFELHGATENVAKLSAQGDSRVVAQRLRATFPLPVIIEGTPAYFMALADPNSGIVQKFAIVSIQNVQTVGIGTTIREAETDFRLKINQLGGAHLHTPTANMYYIEGIIVRWGQYEIGGNTFYSFIVEGYEDRLFQADATSPDPVITITQVGDRVSFYALKTNNVRTSVLNFRNLEFDWTFSEAEQSITEQELQFKLEQIRENPNIIDSEDFVEFVELLTVEQRERLFDLLIEEETEEVED